MPETLFPLPDESEETREQGSGKPRLEMANRQQVAIRLAALDDLLPPDPVRVKVPVDLPGPRSDRLVAAL